YDRAWVGGRSAVLLRHGQSLNPKGRTSPPCCGREVAFWVTRGLCQLPPRELHDGVAEEDLLTGETEALRRVAQPFALLETLLRRTHVGDSAWSPNGALSSALRPPSGRVHGATASAARR